MGSRESEQGSAARGAATAPGGAPEKPPRKPGVKGMQESEAPGPEGSAPQPTASPATDASALSKELAEAKARVEALQRSLDELRKERMYIQAEFDNFRKQKLREFEDMRKYAAERVVATLIDDLENLQRLEEHAAKELREAEAGGADAALVLKFRSVFEGVQRVTKHLSEALAATGLSEMSVAGVIFDPTLHEALAEETRPDCKEREILRVFQKGYTMHGRVLRPAKVLVGRRVESRAPKEEPPAAPGAEQSHSAQSEPNE
jgi:molecular chaperone GrpE